MDKHEEIWKGISNYQGLYEVSSLGNIRSLDRTSWSSKRNCLVNRKGNNLKKVISKRGYLQVSLCNKGIIKNCRINRLVASAFIPNPENKPYVNHIDADKTNNCFYNLEWCTAKENTYHAFSNGLMNPEKGEEHYNSRLTNADIIEIRSMNLSNTKISKIYNVSSTVISKIKRGLSWKHV